MRINIPIEKMDRFMEKLEKLNKVSASPFALKIKDPIEVKFEGESRLVFPVEVTGDPYKLDGDYRVLGTLRPAIMEEGKSKENIVVDINDKYKIPEEYRHTDICECQHCGIKRDRLISFIVARIDNEKTQNSDKEEYKNFMQVGSVCVKNFTDGRDVKELIKYFDLYNQLAEGNELGADRSVGLTRLVKAEDYVHDYLKAKSLAPKASIRSIDKIASENFSPYSESFDWYNDMAQRVKNESTDIDKIKAKAIIDFIKFSDNNEDNNIFSSKVLFKQNYLFTNQTLPLQRVIENILNEELKVKREQELVEKNILKGQQSHLGVIKEKGEFILRLEDVMPMRSGYGNGITYLHKFRDENNSLVSCFFNSKLFENQEEEKSNIENKTLFKMEGKVKSHDEYKDEKQTMLTRIKFLSYDLSPTVKEEKKKKAKLTNSI
jgi:hypothetical protein